MGRPGVWVATVCWLACTYAPAPTAAGGEPFRALCLESGCVRWPAASAGDPVIITWTIAARAFVTPGAVNCGAMQSPDELLHRSNVTGTDFRQALEAAFRRWSSVAGISFVEVSDQDKADIVVGAQGEPRGYAFTNVAVSATEPGAISRSLICLNPARRWKVGYDGDLTNYDLVHTLAHEIGHAIGLDHPDGRGHLMSFRYDESFDGLSEGDMLGAVALYGPRRPAESWIVTGSGPRSTRPPRSGAQARPGSAAR